MKTLVNKMMNVRNAMSELYNTVEEMEDGYEVPGFTESYPFNKDLATLIWAINDWIEAVDNSTEDKADKQVSIDEFLRIYKEELNKHFAAEEEGKEDDSHIYGYPFTLHWNGLCCNLEDGATPYNHLIPALEGIQSEI